MATSEGVDHTDCLPPDAEPEDAVELVEEHRDLFERIAAADVPVSHRYQAVLEYVDEEVGDGK